MKTISSILEINIARILRFIWQEKNASRIAIAKQLDLDKSTVTKIVGYFIELGLVREVGLGNPGPNGGRKPIYIEITKEVFCVGGIEINPERVVCCLLDLHGTVLFQYQEDLTPEIYEEIHLKGVFSNAYKILSAEAEKRGIALIGVGIGIPGLVNSENGIINNSEPLMIYQQCSFSELVSDCTDIPVFIENDARCCCHGELMMNNSPLVKNMIFLLTEYRIRQPVSDSKKNLSIGMGIVMDGKIVRGPEGYAGEFRSMFLEQGGDSQFASDLYSLDSVDPDNDKVFAELSRHVAFLVNVLNIQSVYIGGIEQEYASKIEKMVQERVSVQWAYGQKKDFSVRTATFGGLAVAYGAASMFIEQIFSLPNLMHPEKNGSYLLEYLDFMSMKQRKSKMS